MTNKIKRLISILLVTVLFLLTIQPAFATGNKRKIDDYSIEELLNLSVQEQENLGFYVLAEVPMRIPVSNTDGSRVVSYIDGTWRVLYTKANGLGFYMSGTTVGIGPDLIKNVSGTDYYTSYSDNIERSCPFSTTALVPEQSIYNAKRWGKLLNENTSMRIWHANDVKSVNIDYFDQRIISLVSRIPISVGELTADVLKAISAPVSDWYVMKRIEALLKKGVLQVVIPNKIFYNTIVQLNEE